MSSELNLWKSIFTTELLLMGLNKFKKPAEVLLKFGN